MLDRKVDTIFYQKIKDGDLRVAGRVNTGFGSVKNCAVVVAANKADVAGQTTPKATGASSKSSKKTKTVSVAVSFPASRNTGCSFLNSAHRLTVCDCWHSNRMPQVLSPIRTLYVKNIFLYIIFFSCRISKFFQSENVLRGLCDDFPAIAIVLLRLVLMKL